MCVCPPPGYIDYYSHKMKPEYITGETSYTAYWILYTASAIDIANRRGHSKEAHHEKCKRRLSLDCKYFNAINCILENHMRSNLSLRNTYIIMHTHLNFKSLNRLYILVH